MISYTELSKEISYALRHAPWKHELEMDEVGKIQDDKPIILKINALEAWNNNIAFYYGNEKVWLADNIPFEYIEIIK